MTALTHTSFKSGRVAATIPVKNMNRALAFYTELMGFQISFQNGSPTGFVILIKEEAEIHLTLQPNHIFPKFNVAHMIVTNIEDLYALLTKRKIRIIKDIQDKDFGLRAFIFEDPEGNRIDVGEKTG